MFLTGEELRGYIYGLMMECETNEYEIIEPLIEDERFFGGISFDKNEFDESFKKASEMYTAFN